ncbi:inaD-like protein isoform X2 [Sparus aurata]|uniref:inaD-like protein isoform X2 n=1 Tax=Sparus aurata TaxID=8175 RepID=UPI0011C15AA5|nr:inaD-like protein isoform X2 [Sparus aurata]
MVIRSLVPGGAAERHGGLLPGDQLVSVNHTQVDPLTLSEAVEVLKSVPPGTVRLGIRKPLVVEERRREDSSHLSLSNTQLPVPKGFGDGSILPEDLREEEEEEEEEEEPELILDGGLPRYTSVSLTSDLLPVEEGREMAVDEEVEVEKEEEVRTQESSSSLPRKPPPSWEEWKMMSSSLSRGAEETWRREQEQLREQEEEEDLHRSDHESIVSTGNLVLGISDSRDSEADSELTLTDTDTESVRMIDTQRRKRRSQGGASLPIRGGDLPEREEGEGEETPAFSHWGPPRRVEVWPEEGQSLGLSIVGGRHVIKRLRNGEELKGIFIKQVLPNSPAAKTQCLKTGDKILEVSGVDLHAASHEEAVSAIKSAPSPVVFIVQSLSATPRTPAPPPPRLPPPYRPPNQSDQELNSDLEQAKGLV